MGSIASYSTTVVARYKRDINIKTPNTDKMIDEFLKAKDYKMYKMVDCNYSDMKIENIEGDVVGFVCSTPDYEGHNYLDDPIDFFQYLGEWKEGAVFDLFKIVKADREYLRNIDLDIAKEYNCIPPSVDKVIPICEVFEPIYGGGYDNSSKIILNIPQDILEDCMSGRCVLELSTNGNIED
jgi:hypothetical protein